MVNPQPKYDIPRDLIGYGEQSFNAKWPNSARIALTICVNYEEGAERTISNGDIGSETANWERTGEQQKIGCRNVVAESHYDYGSRSGFWRILRLFKQRGLPFTMLAVGQAIEKNPAVVKASMEAGCEIGGHGYRWIDYYDFDPEVEKEHVKKTIRSIKQVSGEYPVGWFGGRESPNTIGVVYEAFKEMGLPLKWESDTWSDDLPYWQDIQTDSGVEGLLMVPYSYDSNDMKFTMTPGFQGSDSWLDYLKRTFDVLYAEGNKMMSLGLHCRIVGRPGRAKALEDFLDYVTSMPDVWVTTRSEIADHFSSTFPYEKQSSLARL